MQSTTPGVSDSADLATIHQELDRDAPWPVVPSHIWAAREALLWKN